MKFRWNKTKKSYPSGPDRIGIVYMEVHAGRFHMQAQYPLEGTYEVQGETLDDMHYDIDYTKARQALKAALLTLAEEVDTNSDLIDVIEGEQ